MKPKVVVSKCLGFDHCRYDGSIIPSEIVKALQTAVEFIPVCPEVAIGLGVPRQPVRIVMVRGEKRLIQEATGQDHTETMRAFARSFLHDVAPQGFILKAKSPSCGIRDVKIHTPQGSVLAHGNGLFAQEAMAQHPHAAVETEKRLENVAIYEHFLQKIFALRDFVEVKENPSMGKLVDFHTRYKLFLLAHHQRESQILGKIVANPDKKDLSTVIREYETHFHRALQKAMNRKLVINVLQHALGYFKDKLHPEEKRFFLHSLEQFRQGTLPLAALTNLVRSWLARFEEPYLAQQVLFAPYPEELRPKVAVDTVPERDYWGKEEP